MKNTRLFCALLFLVVCTGLHSQNNKTKVWFDKSGKACSEAVASYYRQEADSAGMYRGYYASNDKLQFEGKIKSASNEDESKNVYYGSCRWYFKNGNLKQVRSFDDNGLETGTSKLYYESGKIWKEIEYSKGKPVNSSYTEYNEDGSKNKLFEEDFANNNNEWDLYLSDKSSATISGGILEITSTSKEGTSRYINYPVKSDEYTIEAIINLSTLKDNDRVGLIYGFKDWQNYNYIAVTKKNVYIGGMYEGVKSTDIDAMFCSALNPLENNSIKVLCNGEKNYFSINGEIQYSDTKSKLYGNNVGFVLSGNAKLRVDKLNIKEIGSGSGQANISAADQDVRGTGSGVIFSSGGYILTNYHVIEDANKFVVELSDNGAKHSYKAEVVTQDKDNDLAILKISDEKFTTLPAIKYAFKESGQLEVGSSVFTIGYPHALTGMGKDAKFTDGRISARTGYNGSVNSFQSSIPVQPGNSGGPVFNEKGQMIGVINASIRNTDNVSYAIKLNYIRNLIELLPEKVDLPSDNYIADLSLEEKIKVLTNYVVLIKVK